MSVESNIQRLGSLIRQLQGALAGRRFDVQGIVSAAGGLVVGSGFTPTRTGAGTYTIAYTVAFGADPVVQVTAGQTGGAYTAKIAARSSTGCTVTVFNTTTGANMDGEFHFSAVG